ncbi:M15 family peptidase [Dietzia sp. CQ4]|uniref:peptidoglycan-binding protein n=1 Tax=Dietzia sp. (strain CQ4) TaxID=370437 RepID=UPI0015FDC4B5|nr:M15 family peptidase [Dietzia sp. CQ4]
MTTREYRGNSRSYNGWPFITAAGTISAIVPGTEDVRIEIRRGEVATVLNAWAALWHRRVRRIDTYRPRDYWGWSAENDHPTSCHLSGTAIDLNATTLPFRTRSMPADQRAAVDQLVREFLGVVAWGGHWANPVDEMHTEIAVRPGDSRLTNLARDLSNGYLGVYGSGSTNPAPTRPAPKRPPGQLGPGDSGPHVRTFQQWMNSTFPAYSHIDTTPGVYDPQTTSAVAEFQRRAGISPQLGIVGPETLAALRRHGWRG